ncbi:putative phospholipid-transporting ATPase DRS2 [Yarrowia sp. C11]|nr:putative phospholipid-transporting ATPase DRS2 [Yarrowia sp. C11]KAG5371238.1 putative phospholipid-transporting ATPase DRS2 [Yarrowia sp. E02]
MSYQNFNLLDVDDDDFEPNPRGGSQHQQHHQGPSSSRPNLTPFDSIQDGDTFIEADDYDAYGGNGNRRMEKPPQRGNSVYGNMKARLGFGDPDYSEMDLPLNERTPYERDAESINAGIADARPSGTMNRTKIRSKVKKSTMSMPDFDIRRMWNRMRGRQEERGPEGPRIVHLNDPDANSALRYGDNHISTTKYNIFTFLPKFFFEQFSKYANLFFLATACIQQVPNVSPTNRYTTILTLLVVLIVSAVKELVEDFKRAAADKELNSSTAYVLEGSTFVGRKWIDVAVGDIVKVDSEEPIPADVVLLASSEPEGLCYIETANLDGETNLKIKQAHGDTAPFVSPSELSRIRGQLDSELPNSSLYTYEATLKIDGRPAIPMSPEQMLLRGATLRNTGWIHGLVVFTGHETKLMRNATAAPIKRTAVEHMLNIQIIFLFTILIVLAVVSSLGNVIMIKVNTKELSYLMLADLNLGAQFFLDLLTYWILFSNLVPISLFVTVEIIKFYQAYLISSDLDMYYRPTDTPAVCRSSSLVEELGQIGYVFSDKTGTLTRNIMEFKACSIAGRAYAEEVPEDQRATEDDDNNAEDPDSFGFHDFNELKRSTTEHSSAGVIQEFLTLLATCHTVIPEMRDDGTIKYQAASPDEGALVDGAATLGYAFAMRKPKTIGVDVKHDTNNNPAESREYELLNVCEFNSTRKRMSAILRCPDGKIRLYCKGADTVILERLAPNNPYVDATMRHLEGFAAEGLRTLCLAVRVVPDDEYAAWNKRFLEAQTTLDNRAQKLDDCAEDIETNLFLLGATAIEDKLQEGVPETIHTLQSAGIKVWVLTGDRQETAINIGMSCKLLSEDMSLLIVNEEDSASTMDNIQKKLAALQGLRENDSDSLALVIDGKSLGFALEDEMEEIFLELALLCKAVICCRVSPLQKALVVKLVKRYTSDLLLAIGDGANDVSMIQAAHVGVGISGMEGMQAARSADVSIGQFRYLRKLLLVHGAWSYQRLSKAILYSFYKNIALYMTQFWYTFFNGFSGQSIYESWTITFYNVFFTVLPPFVIGIFDQFISARLLDRYPQLYQLGQHRAFFNVRQFWEWVANGFYHSIILYFGSCGVYMTSRELHNGLTTDHWVWGTALFTSCILTTLGKAALVTNMWTKFTLIAIPGSFLLWIGIFPAYATVAPMINVSREYRGVLAHTYPTIVFWAMTFLLPTICLLRDMLWKYYRRMYDPQAYHYVQEIQKYNIADYRPRMEQFQKAIRKVRQVQRMRKQRGFAFSQADEGQEKVIRAYDTTQQRGRHGEMRHADEYRADEHNDNNNNSYNSNNNPFNDSARNNLASNPFELE